MKITNVYIENFRSIKKLEFKPNRELNTFVGANNTGKSNIFDAITWLLGPSYPSFNTTKKEDRFLGQDDNNIRIKLEFDDGNYLELAEEWIDPRGNIKSGLNLNGSYCSNDQRENYCCAYIDTERKILEYLPSSRWTLVGRILQEVNKIFLREQHEHEGETKLKKDWLKLWLTDIRDKLLFSVKDPGGQDIMKKFLDIIQEESAKQLNRPRTDFTVDLSLYDPWNFYKTLQLIVKEPDIDLEFQASSLGMGVQASISIAILKAYSELNLANKSPIFIDEPELYLHPHAQKNFFKILQDLTSDKKNGDGDEIEGTQVFYTTHSPNFLSAGDFDSIFIVRKTKAKGTYLKYSDLNIFVADTANRLGITCTAQDVLLRYKNAYENTGDTQKANEAFFAKAIFLVEGQTESLLLPLFFDYINFDYIKEGISVVRCGSKSEIDRFYRLYTEFGIPCYILFDGDKQLVGTKEQEANEKKNKAIFELFGDSTSKYPNGTAQTNYLGFEQEIEHTLGYSTTKKGLELYIEVKEKLADETLTPPNWVKDISNKIKVLQDTEVESILQETEIQEETTQTIEF